jgi:uncharacterized RDD family membrane protein YckC
MTEPKQPNRDDEGLTARIGRAGAATGRLAFRPVRAVANAGRDALADEAERAIDGVMAGPLPEAIGRALVEHRVIERVVSQAAETKAAQAEEDATPIDLEPVEQAFRQVLDSPAVERMLTDAVDSRLTAELADRITRSPAFKRMLTNALSSPEVRHALEQQTAGFGAELAGAARVRARRADDSVEGRVHRRLGRAPREPGEALNGGVGTRGVALMTDALLVNLVFLLGGALIALVASLFGTLRPTWLVDTLAGIGWALVVVTYFVAFWSATGQTPGARLMRVRVVCSSGEAPSAARSFVRLVGLGLAIIPMLAGFLPALVDSRRRALPDYLAGTTVVYD